MSPDGNTKLHPDLQHPAPKGPHWDVHRRGFKTGTLDSNGNITYAFDLGANAGLVVAAGALVGIGVLGIVVIGAACVAAAPDTGGADLAVCGAGAVAVVGAG